MEQITVRNTEDTREERLRLNPRAEELDRECGIAQSEIASRINEEWEIRRISDIVETAILALDKGNSETCRCVSGSLREARRHISALLQGTAK